MRLMTAIEDSPERDFNWLHFLIKCISDQAKHLNKEGDDVVTKGRILHATKISYILEAFCEEEDIFVTFKAFSTTKVMFRKLKTQRRKKEKASETVQEETAEEESEEEIPSPEPVKKSARLEKKKVPESSSVEGKQERGKGLLKLKKEAGEKLRTKALAPQKRRRLLTIAEKEAEEAKSKETQSKAQIGMKSPLQVLAQVVKNIGEQEASEEENIFSEVMETSLGTDKTSQEIFKGSLQITK